MTKKSAAVRGSGGAWTAAWTLGIAASVWGCSAGGSRLDALPENSASADVPPQREPELNSPPPLTAQAMEPTSADFIGDAEVPVSSTPAPALRRGLTQRQVSCDGGATTSVSGTVYIPSGKLPLYNAMVYVPDGTLKPLTPGVSCNCEVSGEPIATALTDANGHFVIENVPTGPNIPLVVQVGDWRREFNIGSVQACADNPVPDQTLRLPSRQSEGDIPRIAVATGRLDALECLVRKLGIADSEFTGERGGGRVTLFAGEGGTRSYATLNGGQGFPPAQALWNDVDSLSQYDVVLMSCDGERENVANKSEQSFEAMYEYLNRGGRVFGSHYQSVWFSNGPEPLPSLAEYTDPEDGNARDLGDVDARVITSFPKGEALHQWLANVGAASGQGDLTIEGAQHNILRENPAYAQRWIATDAPKESVQYISANLPLGATDAEQCGRAVLSDIHLSEGIQGDDISDESPDFNFPKGCVTSEFTPQEAVLAFMLFDLSACIVPDDVAPVAPPTILR
ncbi:MAG TPA: carboxypeptidase regulatory-like domain-containing protein [Polyangiaceae bacterium]|jgi:hypothetical protein|nr:carboxypeptidase regulatory-like domain-containing protein [Polyangiaceae bacterium]